MSKLQSKLKNQTGLLPIKTFDDVNFQNGFLVLITSICLIISYAAINFLPFIDFRAYKVGNYIPDLMEPSEELKYSYIMEKDGRSYEFETYPNDESYIFKEIKPNSGKIVVLESTVYPGVTAQSWLPIIEKYGLKEDKDPMRPYNDAEGLQYGILGDDADWVDYEMIVSTDVDQIAITPGY